jgi:hypothetical protein
MSTNDRGLWGSLERRRSTAFLIAGLMFAVDAAIIAAVIGQLGEQYMQLGQAFIAAGWTAGFVGLLGVFPGLADRSRRLAQAGAVFVGIGLLVFVSMGIVSLAYFSNALSGDLDTLVTILFPGIIIGSVLGFVTFGAATLRTGVHARSVGVLFVVMGLIPVVNIIRYTIVGIQSRTATLVIVVALTLVTLSIGYLLRVEEASSGHAPSSVDSPV